MTTKRGIWETSWVQIFTEGFETGSGYVILIWDLQSGQTGLKHKAILLSQSSKSCDYR